MTSTTDSPMLDRQLAYAVFRLTLGINIFVHGAGRIFGPGADAFASITAAEFWNSSLLPKCSGSSVTSSSSRPAQTAERYQSGLRIEHLPNLSEQGHRGERLVEEGHLRLQHPVS